MALMLRSPEKCETPVIDPVAVQFKSAGAEVEITVAPADLDANAI